MKGLEPLGGVIGRAMRGLGVEDFDLVLDLYGRWTDIVPEPWKSHSLPVLLREQELWVEASSPGAVRLLRYAVGDLLREIDRQYGTGTVATVRVQAPGTGRR